VVVTLVTHVAAGDGMELMVDERKEVIQNFGVALAPALQQLCYFAGGIIRPRLSGTGREPSANLL
jgi:hypothetical protein